MKNSRGFTLIEIILSMALLFAFIVPASNMLMVCCKTYMAAEAELSSAVELQSILEVIKAEGALSTLVMDGLCHRWPEDLAVTYQILPVSAYTVSEQAILYEVVLQKTLSMGTIHTLTGTVVYMQEGILNHGGITEK